VQDKPFDPKYHNALYSNINAYQVNVKSNMIRLVHSMNDALDVVIGKYDVFITTTAQRFGIRKAMIQTESFWEYWKTTYADIAADALVSGYYTYKIELEQWMQFPVGDPPLPFPGGRDDSSTGIDAPPLVRGIGQPLMVLFPMGSLIQMIGRL
jgi:hypothetical protein